MENKTGSHYGGKRSSGSRAEERILFHSCKMGVAESIKYRSLEKLWDDEQLLVLSLSGHQKNRK